ncbi:hypothetical protein [Streptomyces acidiscabies]|uniref:Uncharacterized protein n=1 Tax=Streptomyces acidiscabies TaxID=42234 RepID=A0ABU4MF65_9ACTN|nr:hypothetical protein [Streptomyces acidiscabies]MDX3025343.1 hypothetical protein [Streptomyces acidiscabies]
MSAALRIRRGVRQDWTAADFDSYTVLAELGAPRPAARVTRARRGRPLRRAFRAALRTAALIHLTHPTPIRKEVVGR